MPANEEATIEFPYNERKTAQAAAHLLERAGGTMNYMRLVKLLYLADREAILTLHAPITGDAYFSVKYGPILSRTLNFLTGKLRGREWARFVRPPVEFDVSSVGAPDREALSAAEIAILERVYQEHLDKNQWDLSKFTHELPEFQDPGTSRIPITYEWLLNATRADASVSKSLRERAAMAQHADWLRQRRASH